MNKILSQNLSRYAYYFFPLNINFLFIMNINEYIYKLKLIN